MRLSSNKTYILPTGLGLSLILITFLVFVIAITFGHPFSYFITFFLTSIIVVCAFVTNFSIANLKTFRFNEEFIECKSEGQLYTELSSKEFSVPMSITTKADKNKKKCKTTISKDNLKLKFSLHSDKCGISKIPRIKVDSSYPLGIFKAWKYIEGTKNLYTYPSRVSEDHIDNQIHMNNGLEVYQKESSKVKDEFLDHRIYTDSDSWKHIDWKAYARGRGLLTKNFSGQEAHVIVIEVNSSDNITKLGQVTDNLFKFYEKAKETALILDGEVVSRGSSHQHLLNCLRILSLLGGRCE